MRFITISAAVLIGSAVSAAHAQQLRSATGAAKETATSVSKTAGAMRQRQASSAPGSTSLVSGGSELCGTATPIAGPGPFLGDNLGATNDGPAACGAFGADVWYDWTNGGGAGVVTVSLCGSAYDTTLQVFDTAACVGPSLACSDDFCGASSQVSFPAVAFGVYKIRVGGFASSTGTYTMSISPPAPPTPGDSCASPLVYAGGVVPWTNVGAITDGGGEFCGTPQQDIWYSWTATCTGTATFALCPGGLTPDTVIAAYAGVGCPVPGTAIGCDDDTCSSPAFGTSSCTFPVTNGSPYILRIGGFGGTTGSGMFEVTCAAPPPGPCDILDDGTTENSVGTGNTSHDILWIHSLGQVGQTTEVNSVSTAWGTPLFGGGNAPPAGSPARVGIWSDPDNNGDPTDAVLLMEVNTTIANPDTDIFQTVNLGIGVVVTDKYFIGASCTGGTFQAPLDQSSGPGAGAVWIVGSTSGPINYSNLAGASIPPTDEDGIAPGHWLLRGNCKQPIGPCDILDDGVTEDSVGTNSTTTDILWIHSQGDDGQTTVVNSVSTAWGTPTFPSGAPPNGSAARVGVWSDPNGDGDPTDAVVLEEVATVVAGTGTDAFQTVVLTTPVVVTGKYFIGASVTGGTFPAPLDTTTAPSAGTAWIVGGSPGGGPINYANLAGASIPPLDEDNVAPGHWLLRGDCKDVGYVEICAANGANCPCGNNGPGPGGCPNSVPLNLGAHLVGSGNASLILDTFSISASGLRKGNPTLAIFISGTESGPAGVFDGLICVGNPLLRLWKWTIPGPAGGEITVTGPDASNVPPPAAPPAGTPISTESAALGSPIVAGQKVVYQVWYRDPNPVWGCLNQTANFSNALRVTWGP